MTAPRAPPAPTRGEAYAFWLKLGFVSFGGPAGQIAIMHRELVERRRWISERRFLHALNYCMVLPGPEAQQLATYLGWLLHGTMGGIVAGALFVLPSLAILSALAWIYVAFGHLPAIAGMLDGVKPVVVAIVALAAWRIGTRTLTHPALVAIALAAFVAIQFAGVPFPFIVIGAALAGMLLGRVAPAAFARAPSHGAAGHAPAGPAVIDDDTPPPPHVRFSRVRLATIVVVALALGLAALALVLALGGADGTLARMARFFTQAALVTFGGAYAVLPYVVQGAVERYGWLTAGQMIDGLALGETTPGPLIMVVAFVGFVGGWTQGAIPGADPAVSALAAAATATFFTFLPSFLFILAGAPLVEATHGDLRITAPLSGITAAIVGVVASLGVYFATHALWPQGFAADRLPSVFGTLVVLVAAIALGRYKVGVVPLVFAGALAGLARVMFA